MVSVRDFEIMRTLKSHFSGAAGDVDETLYAQIHGPAELTIKSVNEHFRIMHLFEGELGSGDKILAGW